jgi:hypothetical protein
MRGGIRDLDSDGVAHPGQRRLFTPSDLQPVRTSHARIVRRNQRNGRQDGDADRDSSEGRSLFSHPLR